MYRFTGFIFIYLLTACGPDATYTNSIGMSFVLIPAGTFEMGSDSGEEDEQPRHTVEISKPFYMGQYEVTQAQWEAVMGTTVDQQRILQNQHIPLNGVGPDHPMYFVNWNDVRNFTLRLNTMEGVDSLYRLPTEAEWEYVCRAGTETDYSGDLDSVAWYRENAAGNTHPVGQKEPNPWGLFDMHGNVWEWCQDYLDRASYKKEVRVDPLVKEFSERRIMRGGGWINEAEACRSAYRSYASPGSGGPHLGFRVVLMLK